MKRTRRTILILTMATLTAVTLPGQSGQAKTKAITRIRGHVLGESVDEWITAMGTQLGGICSAKKQKNLCKKLVELSAGKQPGKYSAFEDVKIYTQGDAIYADMMATFKSPTLIDSEPTVGWQFANGHLASVHLGLVEVLHPDEIDRQIGFLSEQYGPPAGDKPVQVQNGFGAQFALREAYWIMEDGVVITAREGFIGGDTTGGRAVDIDFTPAPDTAPVPVANPYKKK